MHSSSCKFAFAIISGCFTVPHAEPENLTSPNDAETTFTRLQSTFSKTAVSLLQHHNVLQTWRIVMSVSQALGLTTTVKM